MTRKEALTDLLAKVEAGEVKDYHWSILGIAMPRIAWSLTKSAYHGSLDASKALHEAALPGWFCLIGEDAYGVWAVVKGRSVAERSDGAASMARAWLIAIIKALIAMENDT